MALTTVDRDQRHFSIHSAPDNSALALAAATQLSKTTDDEH